MLIAVNQLFEYHLWLNSKQRDIFDKFAVFIIAVGRFACSQSLGLLTQWQSGAVHEADDCRSPAQDRYVWS
jgi:hypothetical protein